MYYEKLRELISQEEEINDLYLGLKEQEWNPLELRHIFWYMNIKGVKFDDNGWLQVLSRINYELPLSEQEEDCERIYTYLNNINI